MKNVLARNAVLVGALVAIAASNLAIGIMVPMVPPVLEQQGLSARLIGLNTSLGQVGVLIAGLSLPLLMQRFASKRLVLLATTLMTLCFVAFAYSTPVWHWYAIRFLTGIGIAILFTISEAWITTEAGDARRARVMGIYTSILTVTFGAGPFLVAWTGVNSALPWLFGAALLALGCLVVARLNIHEAAHKEEPASMIATLLQAPAIYMAVVMTTLFEATMLSFFTLYLQDHGMPLERANQVLGFSIVACLAFFYPVAQAADRWSRDKTAMLCCATAIACAALIPLAVGSPAIWLVALFLRVGAFGLYIVALALIGDTFKSSELVAASALVAICWGIGGIVGPPLTGSLIDAFGMTILPWSLGICYALALAVMLAMGGRIMPRRRGLASHPASGQ